MVLLLDTHRQSKATIDNCILESGTAGGMHIFGISVLKS